MPKKKKPKPRPKPYLWALLLAGMLGLQGCSILDSLTGADDPEVLAGTKASPAAKAIEGIDESLPPPFGWVAAALAGAATTYVAVRKRQAAAKEVA